MNYKELRTYVRHLLQEPEPLEKEYLNSALNTFARLGVEQFFERVLPYRSAAFVGYESSLATPPDLPPEFVPGGYPVPKESWVLQNFAFKAPTLGRYSAVHLLSERNFDLAFDQTTTNQGLFYGWVYDRVLYVKGSLTPMPVMRMVYSRSPRLPTLRSDGPFLPAEDEREIDIPYQYHTRLVYFVLGNARLSKGDTGDFERYTGMFEKAITQAQAEFREDGVENKNQQIKVSDDFGGIHESAFGYGD